MIDTKFSFVITSRNRSNDLRQTLKPIEIFNEFDYIDTIICNNASIDSIKEMLSDEFSEILVLSPKRSETRRLLGHSYPFWAERDNVEQISLIIDDAYNKWLLNLDNELNRDDLIHYMGPDQLKQTLEQLI